jgi:tyrosinase
MSSLQSPQDPIFWVHHANIDRLWSAWVRADSGRQMPPVADAYWGGQFTYATGVTVARNQTFSTQGIGYTYQDETMPTALPPTAAPFRPALRKLPTVKKRALGPSTLALGAVRGLALDERSVSVPIVLAKPEKERLTNALRATPSAAAPSTVRVVLDQLALTPAGREGGYFYKVYVNLPVKGAAAAGPEENYLLGTVGPFEIDAASHHGTATVTFAMTEAVKRRNLDTKDLVVSFVRVSGARSPAGEVITVGEVRIDVGAEPTP